ncbi:hypothetical protein [Candidatus Tisiphia endosymbiont of Parasteatoda lunata]
MSQHKKNISVKCKILLKNILSYPGVSQGFVASINHTTSRLLKLRFWTL